MSALFENTLTLLLSAAPWLAFGLVIAGLIHAWLPAKHLSRWLGKPGFGSVLRAAIIGTPLPLCSCSVIPVAISLRRSGASRGATLSFLVSTPENGVDSIALSYALLGPLFTIIRPVAGISLAIAAGLAGEPRPTTATRDDEKKTDANQPLAQSSGCSSDSSCESPNESVTTASCCSAKTVEPTPPAQSCCSTSKTQPSSPCCSGATEADNNNRSFLAQGWDGIRYACSTLYVEMVPWLALGLALAGLVTTYLPPELMASWGSGPLAMLLMLVIGIPMYICATASTPLAAAFLLAGISPGTVLVFLLAGPATNIGTLAIIKQQLGKRALTGYLAAIGVGSILFGLATDALVNVLQLDMQAQLSSSQGHLPPLFAWISALFLIILAISPLRRRLIGR